MTRKVLEVRIPEEPPTLSTEPMGPTDDTQDFTTASFPAERCKAVLEEVRDEMYRLRDDDRRPAVAIVGPRWYLMLQAYISESSRLACERYPDDLHIEGVPIKVDGGKGPGVTVAADNAGPDLREWAEDR